MTFVIVSRVERTNQLIELARWCMSIGNGVWRTKGHVDASAAVAALADVGIQVREAE